MVEHAILAKKAREAGAGDQQATRSTGCVGFREFGERHAEEVERRGGEEQQSDDDEEVKAVTVALGKQVAAAAQPTEPKPKTRVSKKWNTLHDLVLAQKGDRERERGGGASSRASSFCFFFSVKHIYTCRSSLSCMFRVHTQPQERQQQYA